MDESTIEAHHRQLRAALVAMLVAFCLWQVPALASELRPLPASLQRATTLFAVLGGLAWALLMLRLHRLQKRIQADPTLREALNDERIRQVRARAFTVGFVALTAYLALLRVGDRVVHVSVGFAAQLGILLAVLFSVGSFLLFDRGDSVEE